MYQVSGSQPFPYQEAPMLQQKGFWDSLQVAIKKEKVILTLLDLFVTPTLKIY